MTLQEIHDALADLPERLAEVLKDRTETSARQEAAPGIPAIAAQPAAMPEAGQTSPPLSLGLPAAETAERESDNREVVKLLANIDDGVELLVKAAEGTLPAVAMPAQPIAQMPVAALPADDDTAPPLAGPLAEPLPLQNPPSAQDPAALPSVSPAAKVAEQSGTDGRELMSILEEIRDSLKALAKTLENNQPKTEATGSASKPDGKKWSMIYDISQMGRSGMEPSSPSVRVRTRR